MVAVPPSVKVWHIAGARLATRASGQAGIPAMCRLDAQSCSVACPARYGWAAGPQASISVKRTRVSRAVADKDDPDVARVDRTGEAVCPPVKHEAVAAVAVGRVVNQS